MPGHLCAMHGWSSAQAYRAHKVWLRRIAGGPEESGEQKRDFRNGGIPVERLSFELLPPGAWDIEQVVAYYRREANRFPADLAGRKIQWDRLRAIESLKPTKCYVGTELWMGYVLFEFSHSDRVILECPVEGNATYVLSGEWKRMVAYPKSFLRANFPGFCRKVVHRGDWISRVSQAL